MLLVGVLIVLCILAAAAGLTWLVAPHGPDGS
jgi:hypothetical protein